MQYQYVLTDMMAWMMAKKGSFNKKVQKFKRKKKIKKQ